MSDIHHFTLGAIGNPDNNYHNLEQMKTFSFTNNTSPANWRNANNRPVIDEHGKEENRGEPDCPPDKGDLVPALFCKIVPACV